MASEGLMNHPLFKKYLAVYYPGGSNCFRTYTASYNRILKAGGDSPSLP